MRGVISKVFADKGYGFIRDEEGMSRFMHASQVSPGMFDLLRRGTHVEFTPVEHEKGNRAENVRVLLKESA